MLSPRSPVARLARAGSMGVWVTLTATLAHVLGEGEAPPAVALVPVVAGAGAIAWWASQRRLSMPFVLALLAAAQVVVHLLAGYVHGHLMAPSPLMLASHVMAIVLTAFLISHVERMWWTLWRWWTRRLRPLTVGRPLAVAALPVQTPVRAQAVPVFLGGTVNRRGPPSC